MAIISTMWIEQGTTFSTSITVTDSNNALINLTSYTAEAQIRKHYTSNTYISFDTSINTNTSVITLSLDSNTTSGIEYGRYVYDCLLTDSSGNKSRLIEGTLTISPSVTR